MKKSLLWRRNWKSSSSNVNPTLKTRRNKEPKISADKTLSWSFAEDFLQESGIIAMARARGEEYGSTPVSPGVGAALRMLAAASGARSVLEIGTGTGVSSLWTLAGMPQDGVLTTIDSEAKLHTVAKELLSEAGVSLNRLRMINGRALQVLTRLSRGAYDMAVVDGDPAETQAYIDLLVPALRPGGILVIVHALWNDSVADPARREPDTVAMREVLRYLHESEDWTENLLPVGDGLMVAIKNR